VCMSWNKGNNHNNMHGATIKNNYSCIITLKMARQLAATCW